MAFIKLRIKVKPKTSRGTLDPKAIFDSMIENWADLTSALKSLEEGE